MQRTALIVGGAAGSPDIVNSLLQRIGFAPAVLVSELSEALVRLRSDPVTLLIVSLDGLEGPGLSALERELRQQPGTFVIGTAAEAASDVILRAMRSGIHEFLLYPPEPKDLASAVDRLMRRSHGDFKVGPAIAVYSAKGGVGTTSVAVNLAFAFAKNHPDYEVALADMVASGGDVRVMLNLRPAYDMGDLLKKVDRIDDELLHSLLTECPGGVWALPASDDPEVAEALDATATLAILDHLRAHFAFTVVDCEHYLNARTLAVLDVVDHTVLVTQLNVQALRSTQRTLALFRRLGYSDDKVHVVVNRHHANDVVSVADATQVLGRNIFFRLPNDYKTSAAALTRGVSVSAQDPSSALAAGYAQLATRLNSGGPIQAGSKSENGARTSRLTRLFSKRK